jgi:hypothetical protein
MNQKTDNFFDSKTPEQKLYILTAELITPIDLIRGLAYLIKKDVEVNNINPKDILERINKIAETADKIKDLRDQIVGSR